MAKPLTVEIGSSTREAVEAIARRTHRSVAFIVRRALAAAASAPAVAASGPRATLAIATDDDDPADTAAKIRAAANGRPLGEAIEAAFAATRAKFEAWAAREEAAAAAERADDLDAGLRDAVDAKTARSRLAELANSEYPRVRALVAAHPQAGDDTLAKLAGDRERTVREAAAANQAGARRRSTK
ncbi:MAG TPA: hypothetical protein VFF06_28330 [Polyangia bacterium]|nr:hypothetical protein [Polyangia bacterium]